MTPLGHGVEVSYAVFSQSDNLVASFSVDGMILIWDVESGRHLYSIHSYLPHIDYLSFIPKTSFIAVLSMNQALIFDYKTGEQIESFINPEKRVESLTITNNGHYALLTPFDSIEVWDIRTRKLKYPGFKFKNPIYGSIKSTEDLRYIAAGANDETFILWNGYNGHQLFRSKRLGSKISSLILSSDGRHLAVSLGNKISLWDIQNHGNVIFRKSISCENSAWLYSSFTSVGSKLIAITTEKIFSYDYKKNTLDSFTINDSVRTRLSKDKDDIGISDEPESGKYQINKDGSKILITCRNSLFFLSNPENKIIQFEGASFEKLKTVFFSHDFNKIISCSNNDKSIKLWDANNCTLLSSLFGNINVIPIAQFINNSKYILGFASDSSYKMFNVLTGEIEYSIEYRNFSSGFIYPFLNDTNYILTKGIDPNKAYITDSKKLTIIDSVVGLMCPNGPSDTSFLYFESPYYSRVSKDNRMLLLFNDRRALVYAVHDTLPKLIVNVPQKSDTSTVRFYDFTYDNTNIVITIDDTIFLNSLVFKDSVQRIYADSLYNIALNPIKKNIIAFGRNYFKFIYINDTSKRFSLEKYSKLPYDFKADELTFSPKGDYIFAVDKHQKMLAVWNGDNGNFLYMKSLEGLRNGFQDLKIFTIESFSSNEKYFILPVGKVAIVYNIADGSIKDTLLGHEGDILSSCFSPDGKYILTTSLDYSIKIWNQSTFQLMYNLYSINRKDYLNTDRTGQRFDGSLGARRLMYYTCGEEVIPLDHIGDGSRVTSLVKKINNLPGYGLVPPKVSNTRICNFLPIINRKNNNKNKDLQFEIIERSGKFDEVCLFNNNKQILKINKNELRKTSLKDKYELEISYAKISRYLLKNSENKIRLKIVCDNISVFSKGEEVESFTVSKDSSINVFCLSVGINKYIGSELNTLSYCGKDAIDFDSIITASARALFNKDQIDHVKSFVLSSDLDTSNWPLKKKIKEKFLTIAAVAKPDDIIIIFLSGHGILDASKTDNEFYFPTYEAPAFAMFPNIRKEAAISKEELNDWMHNILAQKQILIVDACHSGDLIKSGTKDGNFNQEDEIFENLHQTTGSYLLTASAADKSSYEPKNLGKSILVYALFKSIKTGTAFKNGNYIDVNEWFRYAKDETKKYSENISRIQIPEMRQNAPIQIGKVNEALRNSIKLYIKPTFYRSLCLETSLPDDLDPLNMSQRMDQILANLSLNGNESNIYYNSLYTTNLPDSDFQIRCYYKIKDDIVKIKVSINQGKMSITNFEVSILKSKLDELDNKIMQVINRKFHN